jgi:KaiC/GvpD/RAD55 family RecA-like ATPase
MARRFPLARESGVGPPEGERLDGLRVRILPLLASTVGGAGRPVISRRPQTDMGGGRTCTGLVAGMARKSPPKDGLRKTVTDVHERVAEAAGQVRAPERPPDRGSWLPPELDEFVRQPYGQSLLVRGPSGCGKTTLTLSMLEAFPGRRVLVTGRVERKRLLHYYPRLEGESGVEVVELEAREDELRSVAKAILVLHLQSRGAGSPAEVTLRDRWAWLPPRLQELWRTIGPDKPTLVAVDSWEALVDTYVGVPSLPSEQLPGREEIERILLRSMNLVNAHLVLVVERDTQTQLDYLVDGIVSLSSSVVDDRQERWMSLVKLRGIRVDDNCYPFTLDGGRFVALPSLPADIRGSIPRAETDPKPALDSVWPGSRAFAGAFGRLPMGQLSLFEVDGGVRADGLRLVLTPMVDSVLSRGGRVLVCVSPTIAPESFWSDLKDHITPREYANQFRSLVTVRPSGVPKDVEGTMLTIPDAISPQERSLFKETVEFVEAAPRDPSTSNFALLWQTGLRLLVESSGIQYGAETAPRIVQSYLNHSPVHVTILGQSGDSVFDSLSEMSAMHVRVRDRLGRIFLNGVRPRTPSYVLRESDDEAPYRLLRVV